MTSYTDTILPPHEGRGLPRWGIAALIVLAVHIGIGVFVILTRDLGTAPGAPTDAVMIDLAPVAAAPPQPQALAAPPQVETTPPKQEEVTPDSPPEPTPPTPEPPPPPQPVVQTAPQTPPVTAPPPPTAQPAPVIIQTPELPQAEAVLPPPPEPKPVPDKTLEQKRKQQQLAERRKERAERLRKERSDRARQAAHQKAAQAARRAAGPVRGASHQSISSWVSEVQARVNAAAPDAASAHGESGTARLAFTVDASGRVVGAHIAGSSGSAILDRETLAMARRLGRLPPPPNGRTTLTVPVRFSVR